MGDEGIDSRKAFVVVWSFSVITLIFHQWRNTQIIPFYTVPKPPP